MERTIFAIITASISMIICIIRANYLNRNAFGWAIFGLFFPLVAVIWIFCLKRNIEFNNQIINNNTSNNSIPIPSFKKEQELLQDLYNKKVLSEDEYNDKLSFIISKEQELIEKNNLALKSDYERKQKELFNKTIQERIQPILNQLLELKNSNVLTEIEFTEKKLLVENLHIEILKKEIENNEIFLSNNIETIYKGDLYIEEVGIASRLQDIMLESDVIVKNKITDKIEIKSKKEWHDILRNNEASNYLLINNCHPTKKIIAKKYFSILGQ
jgi:hypothetical protein